MGSENDRTLPAKDAAISARCRNAVNDTVLSDNAMRLAARPKFDADGLIDAIDTAAKVVFAPFLRAGQFVLDELIGHGIPPCFELVRIAYELEIPSSPAEASALCRGLQLLRD